MKRLLLILTVMALAVFAPPAQANEDVGGGGGSEEIVCGYVWWAHGDAWPYHWFYTRSQTVGGHCNP